MPDNAHYLGSTKVEYLLHPLFGQEVQIVQFDAKGRKGQTLVECDEDRRYVPAWMTDPSHCARLTVGWQPFVCPQVLRELDALLASLDERETDATLGS